MSNLAQRAKLDGKRAVLVGGGGGIGRAATLALAAEGVDVAICDKNPEALAATVEEVRAMGRRAVSATADVRHPEQLKAFYALVEKEFGSFQILVNVAGGVRQRPFMETTEETRAEDVRLNYGYVLDSVQMAVPMIRRGGMGGSIISFTTIESIRGAAGFAVYAGAKAAIRNFTRALAVELAAERIRVNIVQPDSTPSEGNTRALDPAVIAEMAALPDHVREQAAGIAIPMAARPQTEDLADAVVFLASDLSAFITGAALPVDGGTSACLGFVNWPFGDGYLPGPKAKTLMKLFG